MQKLSFEEKLQKLKERDFAETYGKIASPPTELSRSKKRNKLIEDILDKYSKTIDKSCIFYIIRPDPTNLSRIKFGVSTDIYKRLGSHSVICPELEVLHLFPIPKALGVEGRMISVLTGGISTQISQEVFDIKDFTTFFERVVFIDAGIKNRGINNIFYC